VNPFGIAFNYYKQAQVLQRVAKQKHAQLSESVIDSRPALALKIWSDDEMERGRRPSCRRSRSRPPSNGSTWRSRRSRSPARRSTRPDRRRDRRILAAARLAADSIPEYEEHIRLYPNNVQLYESHIYGQRAQLDTAIADRDFLLATRAQGQAKADLLKSAAEHYRLMRDENYRMLLRYCSTNEQAARLYPMASPARR
jgi:hypothetical protein